MMPERSGFHPTLGRWIAVHGPLWPSEGLMIALDVTSRASHMHSGNLAASVDVERIERDPVGGWRWRPVTVPGARVSTDAELLERVGALLFHAVTGQRAPYPHGGSQALRALMRHIRPEVPAPIVDLTADALTARDRGRLTLETFGRVVRQAMGVERPRTHRRSRRLVAFVLVVAVAVLGVSSWWMVAAARSARLSDDGFTAVETDALDATAETAETFALIDEHTAAIQQYQHFASLLRDRLSPEDARLSWSNVHEAWVRTLAGDFLTTEQILEEAPARLIRHLGERHPYTRTARLALAETLARRGAEAQATMIRAEAETALNSLTRDTTLNSTWFDPAPIPVGVLAHVATIPPEHEGFRLLSDGRYGVPLTSTERYMAEKHGWHLHLASSSACTASVTTGNVARRLSVAIATGPDRAWRVELRGTVTPVRLTARTDARLGVSVIAEPSGALHIATGTQPPTSAAIDFTSQPSAPPHAFVIDARGCDIAWLEILYPADFRFARNPQK